MAQQKLIHTKPVALGEDEATLLTLLKDDQNHLVKNDYTNNEKGVSAENRRLLIMWIADICADKDYDYPHEVVELATSFLDRFCEIQEFLIEQLQAMAVACFSLAVVHRGSRATSASLSDEDILGLGAGAYTNAEFNQMRKNLLSEEVLNYTLGAVVTSDFFPYFVKIMGITDGAYQLISPRLSVLVQIVMADARSIGRRPSEMAVVILLACLKRHGLYAAKDEAVKNFNSWVKTLEQTENLVLLGTVTVFSVNQAFENQHSFIYELV